MPAKYPVSTGLTYVSEATSIVQLLQMYWNFPSLSTSFMISSDLFWSLVVGKNESILTTNIFASRMTLLYRTTCCFGISYRYYSFLLRKWFKIEIIFPIP